jgi:hypothetical protein
MEEPMEFILPDLQSHQAQSAIPYSAGNAAQPSVPAPVAVAAGIPSPVAAAPPTYAAPQTYAAPAAVPLPPTPPAPPAPPAPPSAGPPDPLTEAPDSVWYVRPPSGGQFGPAPSNVMRGWLQEGRISADSLVWREGWRDWQEAIGVFPQLRGDDMALLNAVIASPMPAMPAVGSPIAAAAHHRPTPRQRSKATQVGVVVLLAVVVLVLLGVFLFVLLNNGTTETPNNGPKGAPAENKQSAPAATKRSAIGGPYPAISFEFPAIGDPRSS